jgi:hypothetical protein
VTEPRAREIVADEMDRFGIGVHRTSRDAADAVLAALAAEGLTVTAADPDPHYEAWKADMAKWKADRDERDAWKETARQYAQNADYWRDRLNDHKASLAIQAFTAPDEDEAVMMESLVARITDLVAERLEVVVELRHLRAVLDAIGDLSRGWTVREGDEILRRIADAVDTYRQDHP